MFFFSKCIMREVSFAVSDFAVVDIVSSRLVTLLLEWGFA